MKKQVNITDVKFNTDNPRTINKHQFKKLVNSIKEFPEMLEVRAIVVDETMTVLGGNMRLRACMDAGLKKIWIETTEDWTDKQKKEFIIKDNVSFGEWDWDLLANNHSDDPLLEWGVDVPDQSESLGIEEQEIVFSEYLEESNNYVVLIFDNDIDWLSAQTHFDLKTVHSKRQNGKPWSKGIGRVINGADYLKKIING